MLALAFTPAAPAATLTWLGDINGNWGSGTAGTDTNWVGNTLPVSGDSLVFDLNQAGVANLITTNDLAGLTLGGSNAITFTNNTTASTGFTLGGTSAVTLGGNITVNGDATVAHLHTIGFDLILNANRSLTVVANTNIEISGKISESSAGRGLTKDNSAGGLILSNNGNSFTGALTIQRGTVTVTSIAARNVISAAGAGTAINFGTGAQTGVLNYTGSGALTDRDINLVVTANTGSGTINNNGANGGTGLVFSGAFTNSASSQTKVFTLGGTNTDANDFQSLISNGSGTSVTAVTKANAGNWQLSNNSSSFTGALSVNQGTLTITSLAATGISSAAGAGSTINLGSGTTVAGTLIYTGTGATTDRAINLAATTTGGATINSSGTGALIFTGGFTNAGTGAKVLTLGGTNTGGNAVQSALTNGSGTLSIAKSDAGTWILSGANTYSGGTTLNAGTLGLHSSSAIGTGTLTITGGTLDNTSGSAVTLSTNNAVALNGSVAFGGTNSLNLGTGVVTIGNANRDITLSGSSTLTLGEVQWNSVNASRVLTINQGTGSGGRLVLGGFQLNINADTAARNRTINGSGAVEISGVVSNGNAFANGLIYFGSSTLTLSAVNSYTGATAINGGTLKLAGSGSIATSSALTINAGVFDVGGTAATVGGALTLGAATTTTAGQTASIISGTAGGSFTLGGNVTYNAGSAGLENGQATISANLILSADRTITVNDSPSAAVDVLVSGVISGGFALAKANAGTLRLTAINSFSGQAQINNGVVEVDVLGNIGVAGSLGTADKDAAAGIIRFGNGANTGTLNYIGSGNSTNRRVQVGSGTGAGGSGGSTILNNGGGALVFTAVTVNSPVNVGATGSSSPRVLTLGGANADANTIQGAIVDNTGAGTAGTNDVALVKQDAGVWILAGSSSYNGGTNISGGTLLVNNTSGTATGGGSVILGTSGHLGGSGTAGSLGAAAAFTQQSGSVIFAGQNGVLDAQILSLQAGAGFSLSGSIELDILAGAASGLLNAQSGNNDLLALSGGTVTLSGAALRLRTSIPLSSGNWTAGSSWKLLDWTSVTGAFDNLPASGSFSGNPVDLPDLSSLGLGWDWSQFYSNGTLSVAALVPEPSRALFSMLGAISLTLRRRRNP